MKLSDRDIRILIGLRHGIMDMDDLVDEHFSRTELNQAHEGFQHHLSKQVMQARDALNEKNQELTTQVQYVCERHSGNTVLLNECLQQVITQYAKHLGRYSRKLVIALSRVVQEQNDGEHIESLVLEQCRAVIEAFKQNKVRLRKAALCKKVMGRLEAHKFVRKVEVVNRTGTNIYFHLTKHLGKPLVQQILAEQGNFGVVVTHNYCPIHARHDAMVSIALKRVGSLAREQGYFFNGFMHESEQKSVAMEKRLERKRRLNQGASQLNKKRFFSDFIAQIICQDQVIYLNIEVDNGTQNIRNVLGKADTEAPIIIICSTQHRVDYLMSRFADVDCKMRVFITTINQFRKGGLFSSAYRSNLYKGYARIHVNMLVKNE